MAIKESRRKFIKQLAVGAAASLIAGETCQLEVFGESKRPQSAGPEVELGAVGGPPTVVIDSTNPIVGVAGARLVSYLQKLTGRQPVSTRSHSKARRVIVLGDSALAAAYGVAPPEDGAESFTIAPVKKGHQQLLIVSGRTPHGVKQGVYHVMRNLSLNKNKLILANANFQARPFFPVRGIHLGGYVRQVFNQKDPNLFGPASLATREQLAWNHVENWEPERVSDYVDMLDFFGYNLIESEPGHLKIPKGSSAAEQHNAARRRDVFTARIRHNGMRHMMHFIATLHGRDKKYAHLGNEGATPYGEDTKHLYANYYQTEAKATAPYLDAVMTHWVDSGGWKNTPEYPCTIEVLQELHMKIHRAFKEVNPGMESILGLWFLNQPPYDKWKGYENVDTILKGGLIPKEVGIASGRVVKLEEAKKIAAAGHKASAWGWYLADHELVYTMHVHTHILKENLQKLPPDTSRFADMQTLESCQAETNLYSLYVGARMLCNPHEDPEVYLREVARLVYGPRLEEPVFAGLKAIADIRCGKRCRGYWAMDGKMEERFDGTQFFNGVVEFDQARKQAMAAWDALENAHIDQTYVPPVRFHRPVEVLLQQLKGHVEAVAKYMQWLQDRKDGKSVLTAVPAAKGPFEYYERMQYLKPGEVYWPATVKQ